MTKKRALVIVAAVALAAFVLVFAFRRHASSKPLNGYDALRDYLALSSYSLFNPLSTGWEPGMVAVENDGFLQVGLGADSAFPPSEYPRKQEEVALPTMKLFYATDDRAAFTFIPVGDTDLAMKSGLTAEIRPGSAERIYLPSLSIPQDAGESLNLPPLSQGSRLWLLTEVLYVEELSVFLKSTSQDALRAAASGIGESLDASVEGSMEARTSTDKGFVLRATKRHALGFKGRILTLKSSSLGGSDSEIELGEEEVMTGVTVLPPLQRHTLGSHVFALCIGLNEYTPHVEKLIGGTLPGAPYSALSVANVLRRVTGGDPYSSVELYAPGLDEVGRSRRRATRDDVLQRVRRWRDRRRALAARIPDEDARPVVNILYFCGHGAETGTSGVPTLLAEDFDELLSPGAVSPDPKNSALSQWYSMIFGGGTLPERAGITVRELNELLAPLGGSESTLVLLDTCRVEDKRRETIEEFLGMRVPKRSRESGNPLDAALDAQIAGVKSVADTLVSLERFTKSLPFDSMMPNAVVVYAAKSGQSVDTVPVQSGGETRGLGPLSILFEHAILHSISLVESTIWGDVLDLMESGIDLDDVRLTVGDIPDLKPADAPSKREEFGATPFLIQRPRS